MNSGLISICAAAIAVKWMAQTGLERLNQKYVQARAGTVPAALAGQVDAETYARSVNYTLAKSRWFVRHLTWEALLLAVLLFSGVLPWFYRWFVAAFGSSIWAGAGFLLAVGLLAALPDLPWEWHRQFKLEERFGFNTTTTGLWWMDRVKSTVLAVVLGLPLLALILYLASRLGASWWFWAWLCLAVFQVILMLLAPIFILPLFNKFTRLPAGELREELLQMGTRAGFRAADIQVMDGSKRSRHSNAFFTGLGRFRRIVLFDTLMQQLEQRELAAVLAHEIGHYKRGHVPKTLALALLGTLPIFYLVAVLMKSPWFLGGFGFVPGQIVPAFLLISLLSGLVTFWLSPVFHALSRKHEYEADAFARGLMNEAQSLLGALRKLSEKNLSNLTPHPLYSGFYYSHPTLLEREAALNS